MYWRMLAHIEINGNHYMVRAYFASPDDPNNNHNTYLEILNVNDPLKPWTMAIVDRSFLHQDKLSITDFKVYLDQIYILDFHSGMIRLMITDAEDLVITGRYRSDSGFTKMGIYSDNYDNSFILAFANRHAIYEVDWTNHISPKIIAKYALFDASNVTQIWINEQYVIA